VLLSLQRKQAWKNRQMPMENDENGRRRRVNVRRSTGRVRGKGPRIRKGKVRQDHEDGPHPEQGRIHQDSVHHRTGNHPHRSRRFRDLVAHDRPSGILLTEAELS